MSWLLVEKVLPTLRGGDRPDFNAVLPAEAAPPERVCWDIVYQQRSIGWASSMATRRADGSGQLESVVEFEKLPLDEILSELLGTLGAMVKPLWQSSTPVDVTMAVTSKVNVSAEGRLEDFVTDVSLAGTQSFIRVEGVAKGNKLHVRVLSPEQSPGEREKMTVRYRDKIDLPRDALLSGALSPQSQLANLHVGQTWTLPVYRPFPPNSPVQMIQATVERRELVDFDGESVESLLVIYQDDAGSGISIAREPVGRLWVRPDGTVLQQEARLANLHFRFVRLREGDCVRRLDSWEATAP